MNMTSQTKAVLLALASVLLWSTAGSAFKLTLSHLSPAAMLWIASGTAALVLFLLCFRRDGCTGIKQYRLKDWKNSLLLGFLNPFLYYSILLPAYDRLLAQEALVLNYLWPVFLVLLSIPLLRQRIGWVQIIGIFLGFAGVAVIATEGNLLALHFTDPLGIGLAAGSAIIWALYWIFNMQDQRDTLPKLFLSFLFGWIYSSLFLLLWGDDFKFNFPGIAGGIYIGLFEMGITFALWMKALNLARDTARISNLVFLSPVLSMVWIYFLVGENIRTSSLAGLLFILAGIALQRIRKSSQRQ